MSLKFNQLDICKPVYPKFDAANKPALIGVKDKLWQPGREITCGFDPRIPANEVKFITQHAEEWEQYANINFVFGKPDPVIRITRDPRLGSWSYQGTDCLRIPKQDPTMNLGWLDRAVVLHEFGHALGLHHEHQHPDREWTLDWNEVVKDLSGPPNNWSEQEIKFQVANVIAASQINASHYDKSSIMHYSQPARWTKERIEIPKNTTLSETDKKWIGVLYPFDGTEAPTTNCQDILLGLICPKSSGDAPLAFLDNCKNLTPLCELFGKLTPEQWTRIIECVTKRVERAANQGR